MKKLLFLTLMFLMFQSCFAQLGPDSILPCETDNSCQSSVFCTVVTTKNGMPFSRGGGWGYSEQEALSDFLRRYPENGAGEYKSSIDWCRDTAKARLRREVVKANPEERCVPGKGFIKELPAGCDIPRSTWAECCRGALCEEPILQECRKQIKLKSSPVAFSQDYVGNIKDGYGYFVEFRISNNQNQKIKDFMLSCNQISKSGTVLVTNKEIVYDLVEPGQTKKFKQEFTGVHKQTNSIDCEMKSYKK